MTEKIIRYFGLDVHNHYVMLAAVNQAQQVVMPPRKVMLTDLADWSKKHLKSTELLAVNLVPEVWVPPTHVRELRALLAQRRRLVRHQTQAKNRLQSVLHR